MQTLCRHLCYLDVNLMFSQIFFSLFFCVLCKNLDPFHLENVRDGVVPTFLSDAVIET